MVHMTAARATEGQAWSMREYLLTWQTISQCAIFSKKEGSLCQTEHSLLARSTILPQMRLFIMTNRYSHWKIVHHMLKINSSLKMRSTLTQKSGLDDLNQSIRNDR